MKRQALLLNLGITTTHRQNAAVDLDAFRAFLGSTFGGGWRRDEVTYSSGGSVGELRTYIQSASTSDYALLLVVGSGSLARVERPWPEVQVSLPEGGTISEQQFNPGCPRYLAIFDCSEAAGSPSIRLPSAGQVSDAKDVYEGALLAAEAGAVRVFGSKQDNAAPRRRSLTWSLLEAASAWIPRGNGVLGIDQTIAYALELAKIEQRELSINYGGRRMRHFPFAIGAHLSA